MVPYVRMKSPKGELDLSTSLPGQRRRDEELPVLGMVPGVPQGWDKTEKTVSPWRGDGAPSSTVFRIRGAEIVPESVTPKERLRRNDKPHRYAQKDWGKPAENRTVYIESGGEMDWSHTQDCVRKHLIDNAWVNSHGVERSKDCQNIYLKCQQVLRPWISVYV